MTIFPGSLSGSSAGLILGSFPLIFPSSFRCFLRLAVVFVWLLAVVLPVLLFLLVVELAGVLGVVEVVPLGAAFLEALGVLGVLELVLAAAIGIVLSEVVSLPAALPEVLEVLELLEVPAAVLLRAALEVVVVGACLLAVLSGFDLWVDLAAGTLLPIFIFHDLTSC